MSLNIFARMAAVMADLRTVRKNLQIDQGRGKGYKAVGEADVLEAVRPLELRHGIYSFPAAREIVEASVLTTVSEYQGQQKERKQLFLRIRTVYRFVNIEDPADFVEIVSFGDGVDSQDKSPGKAMTYADKYALLKAYKIVTGEDPDQDASEELQAKEYSQARPEPATASQISLLKQYGREDPAIMAWIRQNVKRWEDLTETDAARLLREIGKKKRTLP